VPDHGPEAEGVGQVLLPPPAWHNFAHVPAYAVLTWLWWRALRVAQWSLGASLAGSALIAFAYGIFDEVHQYFVPGRFLSGTDAALNAAGCLLAVVVIAAHQRIRRLRT
jgi:VanZ family protein